MTGDLLIKPWARALKRTGIGPTCLTSRTLHHIDRVLEAAGEVDILGEIGAKRFQNTLMLELLFGLSTMSGLLFAYTMPSIRSSCD
jgi:hypothetical protein